MSEQEDWELLLPPNSAEIDRLQARKHELLESLGLEALLTVVVNREQSWVKDSSGEELLVDLFSRAMTAGEGKLLALVAVPRESGGFAGMLVIVQRSAATKPRIESGV
jgi:hypothetical protein